MKKIVVFLIVFMAFASRSFGNMKTENLYMNKSFYDCLRTCTEYDSTTTIKYNNGNNIESYSKTINKENDKCIVVFHSTSYLKDFPEDGGGAADIYQFPINVLKKINKKNFDKYAKKYYDEEHSH